MSGQIPMTRTCSDLPRGVLSCSTDVSDVTDGKTSTSRNTSIPSRPAASFETLRVAVRFRPLSERERQRGDREVWGVVGDNTVGIKEHVNVAVKVKYAYDKVFPGTATTEEVYTHAGIHDIVSGCLDGFNGTVFAYGVTSSGKTHTMLGTPENPGVVLRAVRDIYTTAGSMEGRSFALKLSMMEIYNEVLGDLLNPGAVNLKLRHDPRRGCVIDGLVEESISSLAHALSVISTGDANRKVSSTSGNDESSRSHTLIRVTIETKRQEEGGAGADRTVSTLCLIDLAGSESAKAQANKGQALEGSYINKSLLALGSVINKLSEGGAAHVPFRDSKLTRLLQDSLTGSGARVAVICTVTPAASQAEETHSTLKFAARAKKIKVKAERNEILDPSRQIARYQAEIAHLRAKLASPGTVMMDAHDPLHPEIRNLRERLYEEHQAVRQREADNRALRKQVEELTRIVGQAVLKDSPLRGEGPLLPPTTPDWISRWQQDDDAAAQLEGPGSIAESIDYDLHLATPEESWSCSRGVDGNLQASLASGKMTPESNVTGASSLSLEDLEKATDTMSLSLDGHHADIDRRDAATSQRQTAWAPSPLRSDPPHSAVDASPAHVGGDAACHKVQEVGRDGPNVDAHPLTDRSSSSQASARSTSTPLSSGHHDSIFADAHRLAAELEGEEDGGSGTGTPANTRGGDMQASIRGAVLRAQQAESKKREDCHNLQRLQALEMRAGGRIHEMVAENRALRKELARVETLNNNLQGYGLDDLLPAQLSDLVVNLTQAVERVRMTVQLRRLARNPALVDAIPLSDRAALATSAQQEAAADKESIKADTPSDLCTRPASRIPMLRPTFLAKCNMAASLG